MNDAMTVDSKSQSASRSGSVSTAVRPVEQQGKIFGKWCFYGELFSGDRMRETQPISVKVETPWPVCKELLILLRITVPHVTDDRCADVRHLYSDLMRFTGFQKHGDTGDIPVKREQFISASCGLSRVVDAHLHTVVAAVGAAE